MTWNVCSIMFSNCTGSALQPVSYQQAECMKSFIVNTLGALVIENMPSDKG